MAVLKAEALSRMFGEKGALVWALRDASLEVNAGEFIGVMGPSGSGKTTLLNLLATIDTPTSGRVEIDGVKVATLDRDALAVFRRRRLGFVFQDFNLLNTLTIKENIILPLALDGQRPDAIEKRAAEVARQLGISRILDNRVFEVSGGEQQRAAIARAIIHKPAIVLADEPTGNLDTKSSGDVMKAFEALNRDLNTAVLMVTHDPFAASFCQRILFIRDGRLYSELRRGASRQAFFQEIIDSLSVLGGTFDDVISTRPE
ncbi:MAG: ABC transporter ATP-binding protein [Bacillota bacterium]|jgi:putative ABC transport system ATP-binding protein